MRALDAALALALLGAGCAGPQRPKAATAGLRTVVEPATAQVQVDEQFVGAARVLAERPVRLPEGKHRVTIEAAGHFPHDLDVDLAPGITTVEVKLRKVPP